jgi:hypothetical protein
MTDVRMESIKKALGLTGETRKREPGGVGAQHTANFPGTEPCGERPPSADHRANRRSAAGALLRALTMFAPDSTLEEAGFEPSVPRKTPAVVVISGLVAPPSPLRQGEPTRAPLSKPWSSHAVLTVRSGLFQR